MPSANVTVGALQLEVLEILWVEGTLTAAEAHKHHRIRRVIDGRPRLVPGTILVTLRNLVFKGFVSAELRGNKHYFTAVKSRTDVYLLMLQSVADLIADGNILTLSDKAKELWNSHLSTRSSPQNSSTTTPMP